MNILDFKLTELQNEQFKKYYSFLISYNEKVNLTAITEESEVYIKHFYDSLLGAEFVPKNAKLVDVGTGAGFPGVPIKLMRPDVELTLVDSLNKRIEFLRLLNENLNITSECVHARAEDFAVNHREAFDVVTSRAVASLNTLAEYALPLLKIGGIFLAYKGGDVKDEIRNSKKAITILGGAIEDIKKFNLPNDLGERSIIIIKKIKETPKIYPRNKNLPKIKPII